MKIDDQRFEDIFNSGNFDQYWYNMGERVYLGESVSCEIPDNATEIQLLSYRKGILDAAKSLGDLEKQDFYSEDEYVSSTFLNKSK